jgi:hypothetical protein
MLDDIVEGYADVWRDMLSVLSVWRGMLSVWRSMLDVWSGVEWYAEC